MIKPVHRVNVYLPVSIPAIEAINKKKFKLGVQVFHGKCNSRYHF